MALVNCIECGSSVSDKAPACPKCGRPQAYAKLDVATSANTALYIVLFVLVVAGGVLGMGAGIMLDQQRANEANKKATEASKRLDRAMNRFQGQ